MDAPPRGKKGCPAPQNTIAALPRPVEVVKAAGRFRGKMKTTLLILKLNFKGDDDYDDDLMMIMMMI